MTWASGSNLQDIDGRYSHVGGDGVIFDNQKEMEVETKICQNCVNLARWYASNIAFISWARMLGEPERE